MTDKKKNKIFSPAKLEQLRHWDESSISQESTEFRQKTVKFDPTVSFLNACLNYDKCEIDEMLKDGIDINCADTDNLTGLHQASINNNMELVEFLLDKGAYINACDKERWTPLHIACEMGKLQLAKILIERGASLDQATVDGDLPFHFVKDEDIELKNYIRSEMKNININISQCVNFEKNMMMQDVKKWKATKTYNPPVDDVFKSTPLHVAASKNYLGVISELVPILNKSELNAQDVDGWTSLHAAAHWGHRDACLLLLKAGADRSILTRLKETMYDLVEEKTRQDFRQKMEQAIAEMGQVEQDDVIIPPLLRSDTNNRRRSSIIRQSVELKRSTQMKDPQAERKALSQIKLNSDTSLSSSNDEDDDRGTTSDRRHSVMNLGSIREYASIRETDETVSSLPDLPDPMCVDNTAVAPTAASNANVGRVSGFVTTAAVASPVSSAVVVTASRSSTDTSIASITTSANSVVPHSTVTDKLSKPLKSARQLLVDSHSAIPEAPRISVDETDSSSDKTLKHDDKLPITDEIKLRPKVDSAVLLARFNYDAASSVPQSLSPLVTQPPLVNPTDPVPLATALRRSNTDVTNRVVPPVSVDASKRSSIGVVGEPEKARANISSVIGQRMMLGSAGRVGPVGLVPKPPFTVTTGCGRSNSLGGCNKENRSQAGGDEPLSGSYRARHVSATVNNNLSCSAANPSSFPATTVAVSVPEEDNNNDSSLSKTSSTNQPCIDSSYQTTAEKSSQYYSCHDLLTHPGSITVNGGSNTVANMAASTPGGVATMLMQDEVCKRELGDQIKQLQDEIRQLRQNQLDSSSIHSSRSSTNHVSTGVPLCSDDRHAALTVELSQCRDENRNLKSQKEALLRVINKIQGDLENFHKNFASSSAGAI